MAEDLRLRIGIFTATIPLSGTPTQIAEALTDYCEEMHIPLNGTEVEKMTRFLLHIQERVVKVARGRRATKKREVAVANIDSQVNEEINF